MCSQEVPQKVPNSTLVLSHMICPKFNSHLYKLKRCRLGSTYVATGVANKLPLVELQNVPKIFWLGAIKHEKVVSEPMN
jgi:hypothetical protein